MPPGYCINVLDHAYNLEQTKSITLVLERTLDLNLSNNVCFNGKGGPSGQKQDIFG